MTIIKKGVLVASLLLFGAAGCADLDVRNLNAPDAERALTTAGDLESLVAGAFKQWWTSNGYYGDASFGLSTASFQHSAWPANVGMVFFSAFPRPEAPNDVAHEYYGQVEANWARAYRALAAVHQGLRAIEDFPREDWVAEIDSDELPGADRLARLEAYSKMVQGLAHGSLALLYDQAFIIDETVDIEDGVITSADAAEPKPYGDVLTAALGYFDEAIALANANNFTIPGNWMGGNAIDQDQFAGIAHAMKARYMAAVARTPAERAAVNWNNVIAELDNASTWTVSLQPFDYGNWTLDVKYYFAFAGWQQLTYWILGMADQSGQYQEWVQVPISQRVPDLDSGPFLINTPDQRFAQGATFDDQQADSYARYPLYGVPPFSLGTSWQKPDRGTWRWSYYWTYELWLDYGAAAWDEIPQAELDLLRAEALYRLNGNAPTAAAAALVDTYRTAAGLDPSGDGNDDCVPKLPDGSCGDFLEMVKWEKRINTQFHGLHGAPWYFEGRGWGDLYKGTALQYPMPCAEAYVLDMLPCYTFGGADDTEWASPGSVYNWPTEN